MNANGLLIRRLRTDAGLTTRELGTIAHVNGSTISRLERGQVGSSSPFMLDRIARHFGGTWRILVIPT